MQQATLPAVEQAPMPATPDPMQMLAIMVERGDDLDKLERMMDLSERFQANQAKQAYVSAMADFRSRCPAIVKTRDGHNSKFAGLAESIEQIKALMSECGLSHSWSQSQDTQMLTVTCTVTHVMGHSESTSLSAGADMSGNKNPIQGLGSADSYLKRYTLFAILGLAAAEDDTDGNVEAAAVPDEAFMELRAAQNEEQLRIVFEKLWKTYPDKANRALLAKAKDERKAELAEVSE